jgi:hypothetical protein
MIKVPIIERAFHLARLGPAISVREIRKQMAREDYDCVNAHLAGGLIQRELTELCMIPLAADEARLCAS